MFHELLDSETLLGVEDTGIFRGVQTNYFHISFPFGGVTCSPRFAMPLFSVFKLLHISKEPLSQAWLSELPHLLPAYPPCRPSAPLHLLLLIYFLLIYCLPRILSLFTSGFRNPLILMPLCFKVSLFLLTLTSLHGDSVASIILTSSYVASSSLAGLSATHTASAPSVLHESWFCIIISLHWVLPWRNLRSFYFQSWALSVDLEICPLWSLLPTSYTPLHHNTINQLHVTMWPPSG